MLTFRALSALLRYPTAEVWEHAGELAEVLESEALLPAAERRAVLDFVEAQKRQGLLAAQAAYIEAFDFGKSTSLYIFEHVHGESRDRGQAMVRLIERYRAYGLELDSCELPDFLPLVLEFLSVLPRDEARGFLAEVVDILELIAARLKRRGAPHHVLLAAVAALAGDRRADRAQRQAAEETRDDTPEALDAAWFEAPVTFDEAGAAGAQDGGCAAASAMVARFAPSDAG